MQRFILKLQIDWKYIINSSLSKICQSWPPVSPSNMATIINLHRSNPWMTGLVQIVCAAAFYNPVLTILHLMRFLSLSSPALLRTNDKYPIPTPSYLLGPGDEQDTQDPTHNNSSNTKQRELCWCEAAVVQAVRKLWQWLYIGVWGWHPALQQRPAIDMQHVSNIQRIHSLPLQLVYSLP